ncbi:MAG: pentapeptide repeat-containing protein [Limnospira sp. PMC 1291.21]|uniref:Pentapeptide repeat protein n=1 Tax=Limnospira maxima CS-328 TaxID=513049 RepID=B5W3G6_LIMMA|nr:MULTISPECIES: pentapeptide repeat-containing protein [Limnospira]MDC0839966.1 pentapeptide repeat-containing protein [Limnoraphis robusta]QJB26822.1 pentapeptide repeat-containing protein [Limnospira fusiformis SAG 85.79]UWU48991.1 YjbI, contains pentapeptide repeat [Arthrospira platensis C1]EDZ93913.1 pentapeptide repeat protein [Limnospira maxima CS-328]MDT9176590.1 pentapeptide repeat-containing protein [Limnospira sp. PMC 1238.20]
MSNTYNSGTDLVDSSGNLDSAQDSRDLPDIIFDFFIKIVKKYDSETVLEEFIGLFWYLNCSDEQANHALRTQLKQPSSTAAIHPILKRSCYILANNWYISRNYKAVELLLEQLENTESDEDDILDPELGKLRTQVKYFLQSADIQDIRHCVLQHSQGWSSRYKSYLLVNQYIDPNNSQEQQEVARNISKQLREQYKFDLAMYLAHSSPKTQLQNETNMKNPTQLGDQVLDILKKTISTQRVYSYTHQAELFLKKTNKVTYRDFKNALPEYLMIQSGEKSTTRILRDKISAQLKDLYNFHDYRIINDDLKIRTCHSLIDFLTIEDGENPSFIFTFMINHGSIFTLAILMLKVILLDHSSKVHLELKVAQLIQFYQKYEEERCRQFILFLEIFNLVLTIFTENVQYHLVKMDQDDVSGPLTDNLDAYRVFSQCKGLDLRQANLNNLNLKSLDLKGADFRGVNMIQMDLSELDLRLANLEGANLQQANLNGTQLFIVNLKQSNLLEASLLDANLARADLQQANLNRADLTGANLHRANLTAVDLTEAKLCSTNLENADLQGANLEFANLNGACLSQANLQGVNLRGAQLRSANLRGVDLRGACLREAALTEADLTGANLQGANLQGAQLDRVNLTGAMLEQANLSYVKLNQASLERSHLVGAKLVYAQLRYSILSHANLMGANLSYADLTRANLAGSNLSHTHLFRAAIRHADLAQADLSNANLLGANLFGSNLTEAHITGAKFGNNCGLSDETRKWIGSRLD